MSGAQDWPRLFELFERGLEVPVEGREEWLTQVAAGNPDLRRELERLFRGHDRAGVLDQSVAPEERDVAADIQAALGDRYDFQGALGRGGSAVVFLANERKHSRPVVIKVLDPVIAAATGSERFRREVRIAATLSHPYILGLIDSGEAAELLYYVMPFVEGETLRARLERDGRLPLDQALPLLRDIAEALAYAHSRHVVHRDLKPENVFIGAEHAYLMDFGVAKLIADTNPRVHLTLRGHAIGTPAYMAPEQRSDSVATDERTDVYAWGLLAHEMLAGTTPRTGTTKGQRLTIPNVPAWMCQLVSDTLVTDPSGRLRNAREILNRLSVLSSSEVVVARRRSSRHAALGVVALLALVGAIAWWGRRPPAVAGNEVALPIAVGIFRNETGDSSLATWGRLAGDWVTQGLQETGLGSVLPWPAVVQASQDGRQPPAGTIVSGAYYLSGDSIQFRTEVVDAVSGRLLSALPPVSALRTAPGDAIGQLRDRVMGMYAVLLDERLPATGGARHRPPTYEAYKAFDAGLRRFVNQEYAEAVPYFQQAFALDTSFVSPLLTAATSWWNEGQMDSVGTLLAAVRARQGSLTPFYQLWYESIDAWYHNDVHRAYTILQQAARSAPDSRAGYNLAIAALSIDRPAEALTALEELNPDEGPLSNWSSYWSQLTHALHLTGDHRRELEAARTLARRFPDRRVALALQVRALAAMRDTAAIDSLLNAAATLPPSTYWSQGGAMVVAGEELLSHGYPASAGRYLEQAIAWFTTQLKVDPRFRAHRAWMGGALYDLGRWREARTVFEALRRDFPERREYVSWLAIIKARMENRDTSHELLPAQPWNQGADLFTRGRIAAATHDNPRALHLFAEAIGKGIEGLPWLHATAGRDLLELGPDRGRLPYSLRAGLPASSPR